MVYEHRSHSHDMLTGSPSRPMASQKREVGNPRALADSQSALSHSSAAAACHATPRRKTQKGLAIKVQVPNKDSYNRILPPSTLHITWVLGTFRARDSRELPWG